MDNIPFFLKEKIKALPLDFLISIDLDFCL